MKGLTVLGSTGSIGTSTLDVVRRNRQAYSVHALVAGNNTSLLAEQILEFQPRVAVVADAAAQSALVAELTARGLPPNQWPQLDHGPQARVAASVAAETDFVMSAIVGVSGLQATYAAITAGKGIGLANKEVLVACGEVVMAACRQHQTEMIPVDSEHNGAHQCLRAGRRHEVTKLILTASGGPFRQTPRQDLAHVTVAQALAHPTWKMGQRITIDSATMMNKGFEVIEACWLFDFPPAQVEVVVHPQSSVHAMVEYNDGSVIAQVSTTDMRMPIQYALTWPDRADAPVPRMDWRQAKVWEFSPPDLAKFACLRLAYEAAEAGGTAGCTLNAADEVAVAAFLAGKIGFTQIAETVEETLQRVPKISARSVEEVLEVDAQSRAVAEACIQRALV